MSLDEPDRSAGCHLPISDRHRDRHNHDDARDGVWNDQCDVRGSDPVCDPQAESDEQDDEERDRDAARTVLVDYPTYLKYRAEGHGDGPGRGGESERGLQILSFGSRSVFTPVRWRSRIKVRGLESDRAILVCLNSSLYRA